MDMGARDKRRIHNQGRSQQGPEVSWCLLFRTSKSALILVPETGTARTRVAGNGVPATGMDGPGAVAWHWMSPAGWGGGM